MSVGAPSGASDRQPHSASAQGAPSPEAPAQPPTTQALAGTPCQRHPATAPSTSLIGVEQLDWASRVEQVSPLAPEFLPPWHSAWRRGEQGVGRAQRLRTHPFPVPVFWQLVSRLLRSFGVHHSPKNSDPGMSKARCLLASPWGAFFYPFFYSKMRFKHPES